ncbi:MAG: UbiA prenyltransferase family protein [Rhodospirillales bacterium]|nr:UbiA prenyltransferase family protein [Paracoccaceae bacterium]MDH3910554.1 UbiA prenyltransferase family protein [Rhodospirillales bacterium]MDH3968566.1 UbiA prenyltransferase family protein [Rhodospirillales bacterium]
MNLKAILSLIRPKQWAKNAFVAAPLFFTPAALTAMNVKAVAGGIGSFCALASALYILNDFADREADRKHPKKRHRPLAAGTVSVPVAFVLFLVLLAAGLGLAIALPGGVVTVIGLYLAMIAAYSFGLKRIAILDVMIIAFGFVLRVEAGAILIDVQPSAWILIITGLLALFLALAKRRDDLILRLDDEHRQSLNGYSKPFLDVAVSAVLGALLVAYLIYTTDPSVMERLGTQQIFYTAPFVVMGILRYLQIMLIEERSGSPTAILFTDPFTILTVLGWILTFGWLIYV